jgi:hypothetical protein
MRSIDLYASHPVEDYPWRVTSAPRTPYPRLRTVARIGNMLILCFVVGFGAWSVLAPLESAAIAAGDVEAESSRKTIQHLEGGIIQQILVEDGRAVTAGQTLIKLDDTKPRAELQALAGQYWDAKARGGKTPGRRRSCRGNRRSSRQGARCTIRRSPSSASGSRRSTMRSSG